MLIAVVALALGPADLVRPEPHAPLPPAPLELRCPAVPLSLPATRAARPIRVVVCPAAPRPRPTAAEPADDTAEDEGGDRPASPLGRAARAAALAGEPTLSQCRAAAFARANRPRASTTDLRAARRWRRTRADLAARIGEAFQGRRRALLELAASQPGSEEAGLHAVDAELYRGQLQALAGDCRRGEPAGAEPTRDDLAERRAVEP